MSNINLPLSLGKGEVQNVQELINILSRIDPNTKVRVKSSRGIVSSIRDFRISNHRYHKDALVMEGW